MAENVYESDTLKNQKRVIAYIWTEILFRRTQVN